MITLKTHSRKIIDIDESLFVKILDIYPDENLIDRPTFTEAISKGELSYSELRKECAKLLIPWQLFLLKSAKLDKELNEINERRTSKFDRRLIASRGNQGEGVSLRIADRLIALQEYAKELVEDINPFCGKLKNMHRDQWQKAVIDQFEIDISKLNSRPKEKTLGYIIEKLEAKNIRVSRGVLSNGLLPANKTARSSYRKSSGFVIKDDKVPYIFLPNEVSDMETPGRQILTLMTLLILVGLDRYDMYVSGNFETFIGNNRTLRQIYGVVGEILLPFSVTAQYKGQKITEEIRDNLATKYMLTPSAVIVTLRQRGHIPDDTQYENLLNSTATADGIASKQPKRTPHIDNAVKKLCGNAMHKDIIKGLKEHSLSNLRAQYLIFGRVDKKKFEVYKANVGL